MVVSMVMFVILAFERARVYFLVSLVSSISTVLMFDRRRRLLTLTF